MRWVCVAAPSICSGNRVHPAVHPVGCFFSHQYLLSNNFIIQNVAPWSGLGGILASFFPTHLPLSPHSEGS